MWDTLFTVAIWIVVAACAGMAFEWFSTRMDNMERTIDGLESAYVDDVLDAVDDMVFPLTDDERELVRRRVME